MNIRYGNREKPIQMPIKDPITITGSTTTNAIIVADGVNANIILDNVNIDVSKMDYTPAFKLYGNKTSTVNLTLFGNNTLKSGGYHAGLDIKGSMNIIINGSGNLTAQGGQESRYAAGIAASTGNITINGGTITALGGQSSPGILGNITINGGTVTARGGKYGYDMNSWGVYISGGSVNARTISTQPVMSKTDNRPVYLMPIKLLSKDAEDISYTIDNGEKIKTSVNTDRKLYLYLPEGERQIKIFKNNIEIYNSTLHVKPGNNEEKTMKIKINCADKIYDGVPVKPEIDTKSDGNITYHYIGIEGTNYDSTSAPVNVGKYTVTATSDETNNWYKATSNTATFEITKADTSISISDKNVTYDGKSHSLKDKVTAEKDYKIEYKLSGSDAKEYITTPPINAGIYDVRVTTTDPNYIQKTTHATLTIEKSIPQIANHPIASSIYIGNNLSNSTLTKGSTLGIDGKVIEGTFEWFVKNTIVNATGDFEVIFKPIDNKNYKNVMGIMINVEARKHSSSSKKHHSNENNTITKQDENTDVTIEQVNENIEKKEATILQLTKTKEAKGKISMDVVQTLRDQQKTLIVENTGVKVTFKSDSLNTAQITEAINDENAYLEFGAKALTENEKQEILEKTSLGESTGLFEVGEKIFDLTAQIITQESNGNKSIERIDTFKEPVEVTIDITNLGLADEDIENLTGIRYEKDKNGKITPVKLGGTYAYNQKKIYLLYREI